MKKLIVKLKQHTPLIHFQGNHPGATLRASDIKPRLDKWLIEKEFGGIENYNQYSTFIQSVLRKEIKQNASLYDLRKSKLAFDYALRITLVQETEFATISNNQPANGYFGNMGNGPSKYLVYPSELNNDSDICLTFRGSADLINIVKKHIGDFFWFNNFMTRSSKGYGCFSVDTIDGHSVNYDISSDLWFDIMIPENITGVNIYCDKGGKSANGEGVFNAIDLFYRSIRSGINLKDINDNTAFYFKSSLFRYLHSRGIQWDKKTIKATFLNDTNRNRYTHINRATRVETYYDVSYLPHQRERHTEENIAPDILDNATPYNPDLHQKNYRDRLGLSSREKYKSYNGRINKSINKVARIPSPILFKPHYIGNRTFRVYVIINKRVEAEMPYNKEVTIKYSQDDLNSRRERIPQSIKLPLAGKDDLDLGEYLEWLLHNSESIANSIDVNGPNKEGQILRNIYTQLAKQNNI